MRGVNINTVTATISLSSGTGRVLIGFAVAWDNIETTADWSSVTFDPGGSDQASFSNEAAASSINDYGTGRLIIETWYLVVGDGVSSGSYNIQFTLNKNAERINGIVWEVSGANTTDPIGNSGAATGYGTSISADVTAGTANSLVAMAAIHKGNSVFTAGSGDTEVTDQNEGNNSRWSGYTPAATTGTYTVSATQDSPATEHWSATAVEILEAAAGGAADGSEWRRSHWITSVSSAFTIGTSVIGGGDQIS